MVLKPQNVSGYIAIFTLHNAHNHQRPYGLDRLSAANVRAVCVNLIVILQEEAQ